MYLVGSGCDGDAVRRMRGLGMKKGEYSRGIMALSGVRLVGCLLYYIGCAGQ